MLLVGTPAALAATVVLNNPVPQSGSVVYQTNSGLTVTLNGSTNTTGTPFPDNDTVRLDTSDGTANISASGQANATVHQSELTGPWTNVTRIDATSNAITIDPADKRQVTVSGDVDAFNYSKSVTVSNASDGEVDFVYDGTTGSTTVTIRGLPPDVAIEAVDLADGSVLDSNTTTQNGVVTLTMSNSKHQVDLQTAANSPPSLVDASPRGNTYTDQRSGTTLTFTPQDDNSSTIDWTVYARNESGGFEAIASGSGPNGTQQSVTTTAINGTNQWYVELEDGEGLNATSPTFQYRAAGVLEIYDDADEELLQQETVTVQISATQGSLQETQTTNNGILSLENLTDQEYVLEISAPGFSNRTRVITSPAGTYRTKLYNSSTAYDQSFTLDDNTGFFPADETKLEFQERINGTYRTTASEYFGPPNEATLALVDGREYRIVVTNRDGDSRSLGAFVANETLAGTTIEIVVTEFNPDDEAQSTPLYTWDARFQNPDGIDPYIKFDWNLTNTSVTAENFKLKIYQYNNESNVIYQNNFGLTQSISHNQPLTEDQADQTWVVEWSATIDGEEETGQELVSRPQQPLLGDLDALWKQAAGFTVILLTAGLWSQLNRGVGAVVTGGVAGVVWYLGFLGGVGNVGAIAAAIAIGLLQKAAEPSGNALP